MRLYKSILKFLLAIVPECTPKAVIFDGLPLTKLFITLDVLRQFQVVQFMVTHGVLTTMLVLSC